MLFRNKAEAIAYAESHMEIEYATQNGAYRAGRDVKVEGDVNHSFGCAQPNISVAYKIMNTTSAGWGVSAILGDFHLGEGKIRLCLPFDEKKKITRRNWGVGSGKRGSWNNTRIQWEVLEPAGHTYAGGTMIGYDVEKNQGYFERMWKLLVAWNVYIADKLGFTADTINDHAESYKAGMGGNHADMGQWLPKHGKSMDCLRAEVREILAGNIAAEEEEDMTKEDIQALIKAELDEREAKGNYATLMDIPDSYRPSVEKLMKAGILCGYDGGADGVVATFEDNTIKLDEMACRIITVLDRAGAFRSLDTSGK